MKIMKNAILGALMALSLLGPIAAVPAQHSHSATGQQRPRAYYVYYRASAHSPWSVYGGFYQLQTAQQAVRWFQYYGYDAFVR
jgi:hypothetical protein